MKESDFDNSLVVKVSEFLQDYMRENRIECMTPDQCAELLAKNQILSNEVGPKPGFNFRQVLRDGRDGLIDLVEGAEQESPNKPWFIYCKG